MMIVPSRLSPDSGFEQTAVREKDKGQRMLCPFYGNHILETLNPERFPPLRVVEARRGYKASGLIQALDARETL